MGLVKNINEFGLVVWFWMSLVIGFSLGQTVYVGFWILYKRWAKSKMKMGEVGPWEMIWT